ncbi:MAG: COX15/CtaA family protein [Candidatus Zixiibacteriota bacterium]
MTGLRRWLVATTAATYLLIFVGGLVRVSGAGLGCPDWPKCFGRWIPPTDIGQVPSDFDPAQFNITLAWMEYVNRLIGVTIGVLILISAIRSIQRARHRPRILYPVLVALLLVAIQGWQGGRVVGSQLAPFVVTIHMVLAFVIVSLLLYATLESHHEGRAGAVETGGPTRGLRRWLGLLWALSIVAIGLGTQVRSDVGELQKAHPAFTGLDVLAQVGAVRIWHLVLGILIVVASGYVSVVILRWARTKTRLLTYGARALAALSAIQVLIGFLLVAVGLPAALQVFHLWISSLYIGALLVVQFAGARSREDAHAA